MLWKEDGSGISLCDECVETLRRFGCESVGFMDDFDKHEVMLAFTHRGRAIQLRASAKGWAQMYLKENPWSARRRTARLTADGRLLVDRLIETNLLPSPSEPKVVNLGKR